MTRIEFDYSKIPVHPQDKTSVDVRLYNLGNDDVGYDLFLTPPPGWYAGFDDLSAEGGANSASTGLMLEDDMMNVKISFTPPSVMTLAQTELTVILRVISQTEENRLFEYELPIIVMQVPNLTIDLETSIGSIMPGSSFTLQYTLENRGNIDLELQPRLQLPNGWTQNTNLDDINLSWTNVLNLQVSVTASSDAKSGQIQLFMENSEFTWANSIDVSVIKLPEPVLQFITIEFNGDSWNGEFGPGKHPSGVPINYTWLVGNNGEADWSPNVIISLDQGLFGDCESLGQVKVGDIVPLTCTVIIPPSSPPLSEPEFMITVRDDIVSVNQTISMLVAQTKEVSWDVSVPSIVQTGEENSAKITITNQGNVRLTSAVNIEAPNGWDVKFEGSDSIDLVPGQSQIIRLSITSNQPEDGTIEISLSGDEITNPSIQITVISEGEILDENSEIYVVVVSSISVILLLLALVGFMKIRSKRSSFEHKKSQTKVAQNPRTRW